MDGGKQSRLFEHGFCGGGPRIERDEGPVTAKCFYCGLDRLLSWVVDGRHVCGECKKEMESKKR